MNILFMQWNGLGNEDMTDALLASGHSVTVKKFNGNEVHDYYETEQIIHNSLLASTYDLIFSFNYFPVLSKCALKEDIPYFSWVYDSPAVLLYNYTVINPVNRIFIFDKEQYLDLKNNGINTVYYLPLAANPHRLKFLLNDNAKIEKFDNSSLVNQTDIAFVGSLYDENHNFYDRLINISPYTRGYLEGIMSAQHEIYGINLISKVLSPRVISEMFSDLQLSPDSEGVESKEYLYAEYVINRKLTATERHDYLSLTAEKFGLDLYTHNSMATFPGAVNHGPADYYEMAPFVYNRAKINLNITLRSIHTGIPLRAFEILGCGGFLLSNYQSDFSDCFTDGEDYITFLDGNDLIDKIQYFLSHESERKAIAINGYNKLCSKNSYECRINEMFSYL